MTQAAENERLAVRQKLVDVYTDRGKKLLVKNVEDSWAAAEKSLIGYLREYKDKTGLFPSDYLSNDEQFEAFIIYDKEKVLYPCITFGIKTPYYSDQLQRPWNMEYVEKDYARAIKEYDNIGASSSIPSLVYQCQMGKVRCFAQFKQLGKAIEICKELAYPGDHIINEYAAEEIVRA
jgi:hypothetical protein